MPFNPLFVWCAVTYLERLGERKLLIYLQILSKFEFQIQINFKSREEKDILSISTVQLKILRIYPKMTGWNGITKKKTT